ncbi:MAG TPA: ATP-dependent Clp protease ATP-binding subunit [Candidatus Paceibacterota bacterium]|nr:ATP-dependent Clp protease ATP-binding subunit [Candidatus Paceibacterota bacterium]
MNKKGKIQKKVEEKTGLYFSDAFFFWPAWKRFFYKVIITVFISLGLIFSFSLVLLRIQPWENLGILILFFFIYTFQKQNFSDLPLSEQYLKKKKINLARFLSPQAKNILIEAKNISLAFQLDFFHGMFYELLSKREIVDALSILDISSSDIKELRGKIKGKKVNKEEITVGNYQKFLEKIIHLALFEAEKIKKDYISPESLILALYSVGDSEIADVFNFYCVEKNDLAVAFVLNYLSRIKGIEVVKGLADKREFDFRLKRVKVNRSFTSRPTPFLDLYGLDFTELALRLKIGIMIGHTQEYQSLLDILCRQGKRNILLVGPAGVGKDTIVSYLAFNLIRDKTPLKLRDRRLISLSLASFLEDTKEPLEVYDRLTKITKELLINRDIIIYLPQFHNYKLLAQKGGFTALDIFRSLINSSWVPVIAATTPGDYRRYLESDPIIKENFEIIKVKELSSEESVKFLAYRSLELQRKTKVKISYKAIKRAVTLAQRFLTSMPLPSSAESLLTEAIEGVRRKGEKIVLEQDIVDLVSLKTQVPLEISSEQEREKLLNLEKLIHEELINQEKAVSLVSAALRQYRVGLTSTKKPIGVFLFVGPTGVGKTQLAKTLAKIYFGSEKTMIRFDMAEYQDRKSIDRFIGNPEGTISGSLTEAVKNNPFSLILLDEFEKAHSDVLNIFLPVFDEGRLTNNFGQVIDFTNTIIIATSNALSDFIKNEIEKNVDIDNLSERLKKKLTNYFKPELLNRFNEVVVFRTLTQEHLKEIVKLKLNELTSALSKNKKIELSFDNSVVEQLAKLGYNPIFGARPLDSVIRHYIKDNLASSILKKKIGLNTKVHFVFEENEFKVKTKSI